ncbi:MAG: tetratricopeptide repeat protein [Candidatus Electrothrix sp. AUS1_2]|nr:tetratricopeptide repeat protein [Candidatus Electrothrix sp. AUS1_2]
MNRVPCVDSKAYSIAPQREDNMVRDFIITYSAYSDTTVPVNTISDRRKGENSVQGKGCSTRQSADSVPGEVECIPLLHKMHKKEDADRLYKAASELDQSGRSREALPLYEESLCICRELGDRAGQGAALKHLARLCHAQCSHAQALGHLEECLLICRDLGDRIGQKDVLQHLGLIHQERCRYGEALSCLEETLALQRESGDRCGQALTLGRIGRVYKERCEHGEALKYLQESLTICREIGDRAGEGTALADFARIYRARCDFATALPLFEQCLIIFREIGDEAEEIFISWSIGCIYYGEGDKEKAEQHISRAVRLAEAIAHPSLEKYRRSLERLRTVLRKTPSEIRQGGTPSSSCPSGILPADPFSTK